MKDNLYLENLRGSIFVPKISLTSKLITSINQLFVDYVISNYMQPFPNGAMITSDGITLSSPQGDIMIQFLPQQINYIKKISSKYDIDEISKFADECKKTFVNILSVMSVATTSRIAIAPTLRYENDTDAIKTFYSDVFKKDKFNDALMDNWEFTQVFRLNKNLVEKNIKHNFVSKFYLANNPNRGITDLSLPNIAYMIDLDINTFANNSYAFDAKSLEDFFDKSVEYCKDFIDFYFK